jgi:hypothetical protein
MQKIVAQSTAEAEYVAAATAAKEAIWLQRLMEHFNLATPPPVKLLVDNRAAIYIATGQESSNETKHIAVRFHFIRDQVVTGNIKIEYVSTDDNIADLFTKPLEPARFKQLVAMMNIK